MRRRRKPLPPWATATEDGIERRFIQIGGTLLSSEAYQRLSANAARIYFHMMFESGGKIEFEMPFGKYKKIMWRDAFQRAKNELIEAGFIELSESGANLRKPNVYRFSKKWKNTS